tara:strand:+ start:6604 stop:6861 length:258 start_codon:yes stop_codon:yes gene_type:complete
MSDTDLNNTVWTPNDYSNIITIGAAAIGSTLLVIFKSRCKTINLCCGLIGCNREVMSDDDEEDNNNNNNPPNQQNPPILPVPDNP